MFTFVQSILKSFLSTAKPKKYILSQFPYPSGDLHLGHARVYYIGDALSTYYRLKHYHVFYPIGWDSFGLPAENAAILHNENPKKWTQNNIQRMKLQLKKLGVNFNWQAELSTCTPQYYKWTQQIFIRLFKKGLAYRALGQVNWDPIDKTVLANEQVDDTGRSWRSGAIVQKKMLEQWFLKITAYGQDLHNGIMNLPWVQRVKAMQAGWIGYQQGYILNIKVQMHPGMSLNSNSLPVFCKNLNFITTQNTQIRFNIDGKQQQKTEGDIIGIGFNPLTNKQIPIKVGFEQNGTQAQLICKAETFIQINKRQLELIQYKSGKIMRLKDWLISRQRYWGTPIPIIYCKQCGIQPVPEEELPVLLPEWKGKGNPLLSQQFINCPCPKCKGPAKRQTDTMDTFVDSSWYYLRFFDVQNDKVLTDTVKSNAMMPVDIYIGGIEHAIMHLLYARFIMHFLGDEGHCKLKEPFHELVVQGLVKGKTLKLKQTGRYLKRQEVTNFKEDQIEITYQKMSKSKFNGLNPNQLVQQFGSDALRLALFFASPPDHDVDFSEEMLVSARRFLSKVQQTWNKISEYTTEDKKFDIFDEEPELCYRLRNIFQKMQIAMEKRFMHVFVANLMQMLNEIRDYNKLQHKKEHISLQIFDIFVILLQVVSPIKAGSLKSIIKEQAERKKIELTQEGWPKIQLFGPFSEYLILKGKKLLKKGIVNEKWSDQKILESLQIKNGIVKRNKKNIVIVVL